jgi:HAD superfamily hydrolase (TIGR01509 family)
MRAIKYWCDEYGVPITEKDIAQHFGDWKTPLYFGLSEEKLDEYNKKLIATVNARLPDAPLYDGANDALDRLKAADKKLALITSSRRENLEVVFKRHDVAEKFDLIITAEDVKAHKPDPEGIHFAMRKLEAEASRTVMLGDSDKDLGAARSAGIDSILFYPPSHQNIYEPAHLQSFEPVRVINNWSELQE